MASRKLRPIPVRLKIKIRGFCSHYSQKLTRFGRVIRVTVADDAAAMLLGGSLNSQSDADASASTLIRTACTLLATRYTNVDEAVFGVGGVATQRRQWLPLKVPVTNSQTIIMPAPHDTPYAPELQYLLEQDRLLEPWLQLTAADKDTAVGHLWEWNHEVPVPVERCIHGVFADPARTRPEALAIYAWDGELTYGELDSLSNRLAHYLVDQGVIPEMVVPLYFEKSMWTTVAILAVLKAGGAFLLLDPLLRAVRLAMLCSKVHATVAVASRSCHTALHALQVVSTALVLNSESVVQLPLSTCPPHVAVHPHHTVYPKACRMEHRSSCSTVVTHVPALGINRNTRTLQFTAYSFAGSLAETLLALVTGGCVCVPSEQQRREGFAQAIVKLSANWSFMTSTILSTINIASVPTLRTICIVSLGDCNKLAPLGATGEIRVEGPTIGPAFVQTPSWRFIFGAATDIMRFYKTGDSGHYQADGTLQLLGRKDTQVKLHGQRIELEIVVELAKPCDSSGVEMPIATTTLPHDIVLSVFLLLKALPIIGSRKTDRRQLQLMALRTGEKQLQNLWAEVLDLPSHSIGRDDGFFQLGGDSMVAMRLVGAAGRDGAGLTMAHVFNNPKLNSAMLENLHSQLDTVHPETLSDMLPLTSFQNDWVSTITAQSPAHTVHYSWLELSHQVTSADVTRTCKALLDRYPIMRLVFLYLQQEWWQTVRLEAEFKAVCERDTETLKQDQCPTCFILDQHDIAILLKTFADLYHPVKGSQLTVASLNASGTSTVRVRMSIPAPQLLGNITIALLLSKLNVVFGHVVAGRNAKLFRVESLYVPYIDLIPLLQSIHKHFIELLLLHMITYHSGDYLTFQLTSNIASMTEDKMRALLQQLFPMIRLIADHYRRQSENMNGSFRLAPKPYTVGH
ncbi:hypothetical protein PSV09DRAFT_2375456 [Bipolaris maydis]|nr:hypothetical protein J3E74DRAFT_434062 [Bipolaris maydis]KAJ5058081.1 hypothetical protein J3E74DRAFT_429961 [Bipolaris maydis]KAJ6206098.1 hypothetical protein PSV09DRAFT_2375456 [Bipolaris maydis]